ncbi:MAG: hypothetical protein ACJ8EU_03245 [Xanthobacteraceae bacterium]
MRASARSRNIRTLCSGRASLTDPGRDLVPVVSLSDNFIGIAVSAALKVNSLDEFVKLARSQPES